MQIELGAIPNNTSNKTISCLPELEDLEGNTISERQGASFGSGDYSVSLPASIVVKIEKNKRYNFRLYCCYDGDTTYVVKIKRAKYNFVFATKVRYFAFPALNKVVTGSSPE